MATLEVGEEEEGSNCVQQFCEVHPVKEKKTNVRVLELQVSIHNKREM